MLDIVVVSLLGKKMKEMYKQQDEIKNELMIFLEIKECGFGFVSSSHFSQSIQTVAQHNKGGKVGETQT